jgi:hypothetical protein
MSDRSTSAEGQRNLRVLLKTMSPVLQSGEYVFCSISEDRLNDSVSRPWGMFREAEGITLIVPLEQAIQSELPQEPRWRLITLSVHSDLQAVGFLAAITAALAKANISVNAVSAYFHDHLFVLSDSAEAAMECLTELSKQA